MKIVVTGGAGYIGSFMTKVLLDHGHEVIVFDSLERGHSEAIDSRAQFIKGDLNSKEDLNLVFTSANISAVMHFAGLISVEESTKNPDLYYKNNVLGSKNLFEVAMKIGKVNNFIFSSTAAVYGNPIEVPIPEGHPKSPTSPYGKTKLDIEKELLSIREENNSVSYAALRYFNAAGGALDGQLGEKHNPETHIIPLAIKAALSGAEFSLYGTDYATPDGTCVRDYIHVLDLAEAHLLSLNKLMSVPGGYNYNVGVGKGYSNREVIDMVQKISGKQIIISEKTRRAGDSDQLVADPTKINQELGFSPKYSDLETIVKTAWDWHSNQA